MPDIVLLAETKRPLGSANSRRLRHHGRIPAVVYGHGIDSAAVSVDARALRAALSTAAGQNVVLELEIEGDRHLAMAKVVDHHPVRHTIAHVDFLVVSRDVKVTADVPVTLVGEALLVTREGGSVEQLLHNITLSMLPSEIPDAIELSIEDSEIGGVLRVSDLAIPAGVTTEIDAETPVVTGAAARVVEEAPVVETPEGGEAAPAAACWGLRGFLKLFHSTPADWLVLGLGNPGAEYEGTRHNAGAAVVAELAKRHGERLRSGKEHAVSASVRIDGKLVALAFPMTYMNDSGRAARALVRRYHVTDLAHLVVVHDEIDLPAGRLQVKYAGGLAGHNGLKSIRDHLHTTDFVRVRIGVGRPPGRQEGADHVLSKPGKSDNIVLDEAADAVEAIITDGLDAAMNRYNRV